MLTLQSTPNNEVSKRELVADNVGTKGEVLVEFLETSIQLLEIRGAKLDSGKVNPLIHLLPLSNTLIRMSLHIIHIHSYQSRADRIRGVVKTSFGNKTTQETSDRADGIIVLTNPKCPLSISQVVSIKRLFLPIVLDKSSGLSSTFGLEVGSIAVFNGNGLRLGHVDLGSDSQSTYWQSLVSL